MRIYTHCEYIWDGTKYLLDETGSVWYDYDGPVELCCGATQSQTNIQNQQTSLFSTLQQQLSTVFGNSSNVFQDLVSSFSPIVAAGPNQQGFSAPELSNLNSEAITQVGQSYNNAKEAVGEQTAAYGGGNTPGLPAGATIGINEQLAASAANQTSGELSQITQANYAQGRQNWLNAASGLAGAPNVFNPATSAGNAATSAGGAASNTANQIAQEDNSWVNSLIGAGAGIAGAAAGGFAGSFNGGGSTPDADMNQLGWNQSNPYGSITAPTSSSGVPGTVPGF